MRKIGNSLTRTAARRSSASVATLTALWLASAWVASGHDLLPGEPQTKPVLLRGGDLYTVANGVKPGTDLLFEDGAISKIGRNLRAPDDAEIVDLTGKRVYPGLIAPYTYLGLIEIGAVRATNDRAELGAITPEVAAHIAYNPDSELIPSVRSHGITTAQVVPAGSLVRGQAFLTQLDGWTKEQTAIRLLDGLYVGWPATSIGRVRDEKKRKERQEALDRQHRELREAFELARAYDQARTAGTQQTVDVRWEAMRPIFAGEQPVYIVADGYRQIEQAVAFANEQRLRMILVGGRDSHLLTELLLEHDISVILGSTLALPRREDEDYDIAFRLPALLHEAGVPFCLSHVTWGAWAVRNLPFQAGQAVAFGLPEEVALRAMTLSTAQILGISDSQGSLEVGKAATLFVSEGDVMDMLGQRVTQMWIDGRAVDLNNRHKKLYDKYRQKPVN